MPNNKWTTFISLLYLIDFILSLYFAISLIQSSIINRPQGLPFLFFPEGLFITLFLTVAIILGLLTYGVWKIKKWAYKLGITLGIFTLVSLISRFDIYSILPTLSAVLLFFNRKKFK